MCICMYVCAHVYGGDWERDRDRDRKREREECEDETSINV